MMGWAPTLVSFEVLMSTNVNVFENFPPTELAAAQKADTGLKCWFDYVNKGLVVPRRSFSSQQKSHVDYRRGVAAQAQ